MKIERNMGPIFTSRRLARANILIIFARLVLIFLEQQIQISYARAVALGKASGLRANDCVTHSNKFWKFLKNPLVVYDNTTSVIVSIHYNLCLTTVGRYARNRPDLNELISKLETWEINGQYMLSELGHGLDIINMETTATYFDSVSSFVGESEGGERRKGFILHTPSDSAQKWMPPSTPMGGIPKIALVHAKLIVGGEFKGIRMFIVPLTDGREMCKGIQAKFIGPREGNQPLDHALTRFTHVELPLNALLCNTTDIEREIFGSESGRTMSYFAENTQALHTSKIALTIQALNGFKSCTYIACKYSLWRDVVAKGIGNGKIPIITFRTQQIPLLYSLVKALVFSAWTDHVTGLWENNLLTDDVRKAVSAIYKQLVTYEAANSERQLMERCGAQGIFLHNNISNCFFSSIGLVVAEGDILVVGIKVISDLLMGKYSIPPPMDPSHLLSQHEISLFDEARAIALSLSTLQNRSEEYNRQILPICADLMNAVGFRMAYEVANQGGISKEITDLFVSAALEYDPAWYSEHLNLTRQQQRDMRDKAIDRANPFIDKFIQDMNIADCVAAPILTPSTQLSFHNSLPSFIGTSLQMPFFSNSLTSKL